MGYILGGLEWGEDVEAPRGLPEDVRYLDGRIRNLWMWGTESQKWGVDSTQLGRIAMHYRPGTPRRRDCVEAYLWGMRYRGLHRAA